MNFGPQSPNLATTRPASDTTVQTGDSWFQDCSGPGNADGTIVTASWLNIITAQISGVVTGAGQTINTATDSNLYDSIAAMIAAAATGVTAGNGIDVTGSVVSMDLGNNSNGTLAFGALSAVDDKLPVYDASGANIVEVTPYTMVKTVLQDLNGIAFDDINGRISGTMNTYTASATAPVGVTRGDLWYDTTNDRLNIWFFDGTSEFWREF